MPLRAAECLPISSVMMARRCATRKNMPNDVATFVARTRDMRLMTREKSAPFDEAKIANRMPRCAKRGERRVVYATKMR